MNRSAFLKGLGALLALPAFLAEITQPFNPPLRGTKIFYGTFTIQIDYGDGKGFREIGNK